MTTSPAAHHLTTIRTLWTDLDDALDQHGTNWLASRADLFATLDQTDADEAATLRALERDPQQIGETRAPLSIHILDTTRLVETTLVHLADTIAPQITHAPLTHAHLDPHQPGRTLTDWQARGWTRADREQRNTRADIEQGDPRRWRYVGLRTAEYAAGWLLARVEGHDGPFRELTAAQLHHIEQVAAGCAARVETALDLLGREYTAARPCPRCAGQILVTAGGGRDPQARCAGDCGHTWTLADTAAA